MISRIFSKFVSVEDKYIEAGTVTLEEAMVNLENTLNNTEFSSENHTYITLLDVLEENNLISDRYKVPFHYINFDLMFKEGQFIVLKYKGTIVGISCITDYKPLYNQTFSNEDWNKYCISHLSIHDSYKGQGFSKYLIAHTLNQMETDSYLYITNYSSEGIKTNIKKYFDKMVTQKLIDFSY